MHYRTLKEVFHELNTSLNGLSEKEAKKRLEFYGFNELEEVEENRLKILLRQFSSPLIIVLIIAGAIALILREYKDTIVIYATILINGILGFSQEVKAISSIKALKSLVKGKIKVIRNGKEKEVDISFLVPGDVVILKEGDVVPADIRLIKTTRLLIDEAPLTGESIPVEKDADVVLPIETPIYERKNCAFKGTDVLRGSGIGVVYATGKATELGKIAEKAIEAAPESPLTKALKHFVKKWIGALLILMIILFIFGILQGRDIKIFFFFVVALLVSAVPEGLPIVITIALVVGAIRLSRRKTLVKYLPAVETLGSATYICSDKTGTVTEGKLKVEKYEAKDLDKLYRCSALCNDSDGKTGDPLEKALLDWLEKENISWQALRHEYSIIWKEPFDTKKRYMAVLVKNKIGKKEFYIKGAFESVSKFCSPECDLKRLKELHDKMAQKGLKVLIFGYAEVEDVPAKIENIPIKIAGLIGFLDPPKEGVKEAVETAKQARIKIILITGDNLLTAKAIAIQTSIYYSSETIAIEGKDIEKLSDEGLYTLLKRVSVVARVTPEDKYRIVKILQSKGEIVVVTGDGINDVPAVKIADLGIAMGSGTQATKEAAKMIIIDNNLAIIIQAIYIGRQIAKNIGKVIRYLLSTNIFEIFYNAMAIILKLPLPLYPTQILWINLVTDGVQDKIFPFTKSEEDLMKQKPHRPEKSFINFSQILKSFYNGIIMATTHLILFIYLLKVYSYEVVLTISFTSAVISQWSVGIQEINERPFFLNPLAHFKINPYIYIGVLLGAILQFTILTYLPDYFHAIKLPSQYLIYIFIAPIITFFSIEIRKWFELIIKKI